MKFKMMLQSGLLAGFAFTTSLTIAATPTAFLNNATITTVPNSIMATRVPIQDSTGKVVYKDVQLNFLVSNTGLLSLSVDSPIVTASPNLLVSGFKPGQYKDAVGNKYTLIGPGVISGSTRTSWSLSLNSGSTQANQVNFSWFTGAIIGHPNETAIKARSLTTTALSWGIVGINQWVSGAFPFYPWSPTQVIGVAQIGNNLVLHWFAGLDNTEDASVALQLCATPAC